MAHSALAAAVLQADADGPSELETKLLGSADPSVIATTIADAVAQETGSGVGDVLTYNRGTGLSVGLGLDDGRQVFVKIHRRDLVGAALGAVRRVHADLHRQGLPVPAPLYGPMQLGTGVATIDEYVPPAPLPNVRSAEVRRVLAVGLHRFITAALQADSTNLPYARGFDPNWGELYPPPHDYRFDFAATTADAEWIDGAARIARAESLLDRSRVVVGHIDWRPDNVSLDEGAIRCIYDWDSVALIREATLIGSVAAAFCCTWQAEAEDPIPTVAEGALFVEEYERARGQPFSNEERKAVNAAHLYTTAYGARCAHASLVSRGQHPVEEVGWHRLLRERLLDASSLVA